MKVEKVVESAAEHLDFLEAATSVGSLEIATEVVEAVVEFPEVALAWAVAEPAEVVVVAAAEGAVMAD